MSLVDPSEPVCSRCFSDEDIAAFISDSNGPRGCAFCRRRDAPTAPLEEVAVHMRACLGEFYGLAVEQLPYDGREGGYQGRHWDTRELLYDEIQLDLPRDQDGSLDDTLPDLIGDESWCDWDWLCLDYDKALTYAWASFCEVIQHRQRYFFALDRGDPDETSKPDYFTPLTLLHEIRALASQLQRIMTLPRATELYRARPCAAGRHFSTARELGPPPAHLSTQANRMNPPGIPMMYASESADVAFRETRCARASLGRFRLERAARILDLAQMPSVPGIFSGAGRKERLGLIFMHAFAQEIGKPVDRSDRIHIDYIPSQVVTEFIRGAKVDGGSIDGIRYPSVLVPGGCNIVLFATQADLAEPDGTPVSHEAWSTPEPWIRLVKASYRRASRTPTMPCL